MITTILHGLFNLIWRSLCWLAIDFILYLFQEVVAVFGRLIIQFVSAGKYPKTDEECFVLCTLVGFITASVGFYGLAYLYQVH